MTSGGQPRVERSSVDRDRRSVSISDPVAPVPQIGLGFGVPHPTTMIDSPIGPSNLSTTTQRDVIHGVCSTMRGYASRDLGQCQDSLFVRLPSHTRCPSCCRLVKHPVYLSRVRSGLTRCPDICTFVRRVRLLFDGTLHCGLRKSRICRSTLTVQRLTQSQMRRLVTSRKRFSASSSVNRDSRSSSSRDNSPSRAF